MPEVWHKVVFKGCRKWTEVNSLFNSGSGFIVLPANVAKDLDIKSVGKAEIELANGKILRRDAYEVEVDPTNEETGEVRKAKSYATIERRDYPLIGTMAMEKLRVIPDVVKGRVLFV